MPITVYFATNRTSTGSADPTKAYDFTAQPLGQLTFGSAQVSNANIAKLETGNILSLGPTQSNAFRHADELSILNSGKNILVFVHGFANSFNDGIVRAAFNTQWFASANVPDANTTVIAFSWPSEGDVVDPDDIAAGLVEAPLSLLLSCFGQLHNPLCHAYENDRQRAKQCGPAMHSFLDRITPLLLRARAMGRRVTLLAHSMGNLVTSRGIDAMRTTAMPESTLFDEVVLAASDADWAQDSSGTNPPDWLLAVPHIARRISVYYSHNDKIVELSAGIVDLQRMGYAGPADINDPVAMPAGTFRFVDCANLPDNEPEKTIDSCHQYYRRLKPVRDDIAHTMAGQPSDRMVTL